jgi:hypothetical protein
MQFKKLAAVTGTALMAGMSIAAPVLAATVADVGSISDIVSVSDSTVSYPLFVVGAAASTADVAGAINVAVNLAAESKTTEDVTVSGTSESVTGGVKVASSGNQLVPYEHMQSVRTVLTSTDLPTILAAGSYQNAAGSSYTFKQYLYLGGESANTNHKPTYTRPTTENSPRMTFKENSGSVLYTYKLTFGSPVSFLTNGVADIQGTTINFLGKDFVISDATVSGSAGAYTTIDTMTLLGGQNVVTISTASDQTATVNGKDYVVHLDGVATETVGSSNYLTAVGDVNGESFSMRSGQTATLSDGTIIAAVKVIQGKTGEADYAKLAVGADKIKISKTAGTAITKGTKTVSEVTSEISSATGLWSYMTITYTPSSDVWLSAGEKTSDPFSSAFDLQFNGITPDFDDSVNRQTITFSPSGYNMMMTYENAGGDSYQAYTLYSTDGVTYRWAAAGSGSPSNYDNNYRDLVFDECQNISAIEQDYFVIQKGGFSHIMQFSGYTASTGELLFTNEAGESITATNDSNGRANLIVDGNTYKAIIVDATKKIAHIDLNGDAYMGVATAASSYVYANATLGAQFSFLVPKLVTSGHGGLHFYKPHTEANLTGASNYPQIGFAGLNISNNSTGAGTVVTVSEYTGANTWTAESTKISIPAANAYSAWTNFTTNSTYIDYMVRIGNNTENLNYSVSMYNVTGRAPNPGFIFVQEALEGGSTHNWVYIPVTFNAVGSIVYTTTPLSDDSNYDATMAVIGTATQYKSMTTYGTLVEYFGGAAIGGPTTLNYPDTYTYANLYLLGPDGKISTSGTAGTVTTDKVFPITTDIVRLDSEVTDSDKTGRDLVLLGGPCINTLVADLATAEKFDYGCASWPGRDFGMVSVVNDAFTDGKVALVIAGTRAADTDLAAGVVQAGTALEGQAADTVEVTGSVSSPTITTA